MEPNTKKIDGYVERDNVVIDGMDISGHWNRMLEPRWLQDYSTDAMDWVTSLKGAESLSWCYQCAKCVPVCPVEHVGSYGPRKLVRKVQLGNNLMEDPDLWLCTSCAACLRVCPKAVDMIQIMPALREQAVLEGKIPDELADAFSSMEQHGNPLGQPARKRVAWTKGLDVDVPILSKIQKPVDVLWYVSDYTSYHPRGHDAARAMARVLTTLGIDFAILGQEEKCDGDSPRAAGERGLFEMLAEQNIETFEKYEFDKLVVMDPHAYNAFKNHYPKMGGEYNVLHYTQLLVDYIDKMEFKGSVDATVTYHDPCYLGRHNGEYDAPRKLLEAIPGVKLTEMPHYKATGFCCGGGGGGMWLDGLAADHQSERLSERRVREAVGTGADVLSVACPYEPSRFEDAVKSTGNAGSLDVLDIIELIDRAMHPDAEA
ncbi:MAG: (Fe-S)-binding protein [Gemmatimonadota bacterium]|nr:(Fe-S)-binding protein [Gemmatimonadota bacterium]